MRRIIICLAFLTACGGKPVRELPEPVQFIDKSVITFPNVIGRYVLRGTEFDPELWTSGVTSQWIVEGAPNGLFLSVFVYPIGAAGEFEAVERLMADFEQSVRNAAEQGAYSDLVVGERTPFAVVARRSSIAVHKREAGEGGNLGYESFDFDASADLAPRPETTTEPADASDPIAAALASATVSPNSHGQRQLFSFTRSGELTRSLGYVFYRHLFAFKVRVSVSEASMDDATFEALADTAARNLVPRINVENYGRCGTITISSSRLEAEGQQPSDALAAQLIRDVAAIQNANCAAREGGQGAGASTGLTRVEIVYPAESWRVVP